MDIGTGGGIETLDLLKKGNQVTTVEIDKNTALRTRKRIERNHFAEQHCNIVSHISEVHFDERFHEIYMCEVLEHILEDFAILQKLSKSW